MGAALLRIGTVRSQVVALVLASLVLPLTSLLVTAGGGLGAGDTVTSGAATGTVIGLLALGAWAAAVAAGEYGRAGLLVSLATVPRRSVLVGSTLVAICGAAAAAALVGAGAAFGVVRAVAPRGHALGDPVALLAVVPAVVAVTAVGVAAAVLSRSTTAATAVVVVLVLLPRTAAGLLGGLQPWVVGASPGTVVAQVVGNGQLSSDEAYPLGTAAAVVTLVAVAAVIAVSGALAFGRRDG